MTTARRERLENVLARRTRDLTIVIDRLDKPHNYMAVLRTCEAFGIQDIHLVIPDNQDGDTISSGVTQGAHKWLTLHTYRDWEACFDKLRQNGYRLYASCLSPTAGTLESFDLADRTALIFGNELEGLTSEQTAACDGVFMLPMEGFSQSFNISVACALSVQRFFLARAEQGLTRGKLSDTEQTKLRVEWMIKAVPHSDRILEEEQRREANEAGKVPAEEAE